MPRTHSSTIVPLDFTTLISELAGSACATQRIFDRAYEDDLRRLDAVARALAETKSRTQTQTQTATDAGASAEPDTGPAARETRPSPTTDAHALLAALTPNRLVVREITISCDLRCTQNRRTGFSVQVTPLNLAYERRFGSMRSSATRLTLTVVQSPPSAPHP